MIPYFLGSGSLRCPSFICVRLQHCLAKKTCAIARALALLDEYKTMENREWLPKTMWVTVTKKSVGKWKQNTCIIIYILSLCGGRLVVASLTYFIHTMITYTNTHVLTYTSIPDHTPSMFPKENHKTSTNIQLRNNKQQQQEDEQSHETQPRHNNKKICEREKDTKIKKLLLLLLLLLIRDTTSSISPKNNNKYDERWCMCSKKVISCTGEWYTNMIDMATRIKK